MSLIDSASLIVTPNAYKEGTLYSVIPSDGSGDLSVTRATTATRVNSAGLVELVPYNLLQQSNNFDTTWAINGTGGGTITSGQIDPNGEASAWLFSKLGLPGRIEQVLNVGGTQTFFIYAKKNTSDFISIIIFDGSVAHQCYFNLSTGTVGTQSASTGAIESVGNGWYKCIMTSTNLISSGVIQIYLSNNDGTITGTTGSAYIFNSQLNDGSTALPYQKTETRLNIPRLDYSNGTCPSILVEPQRTNLALYSSSFDNAYWAKENATITANSVISPDGTQNADTLTDDAVNGRHRFQTYFTGTAGTSYTLSIYVKKNSANRFLLLNAQSIIGQKSVLNLDTLEITNLNGASGQVVDAGNGWYRFSVSGTYITASNYYIQMQNSASDVSYVGNGSSFYLWGAQLEAGSYPTSYIPTTSASVTRNADVISKTGISSLIGQTEGTLYAEFAFPNLNAGGAATYVYITSGTFANSIIIGREPASPNSKLFFYINAGGSNILNNTTNNLQSGFVKMAIAYKSGDWAAYLNGTLVASGTNTLNFNAAMNRFGIGSNDQAITFTGDSMLNKASALWKTRLTNDELERLTGVGFNTYTEMANYYNYITQ